jgi:hypothetical protein
MRSKGNWEREAAARLPELLGEWLNEPIEVVPNAERHGVEVDLTVSTPTRTILVEVRGSDDIASLERGAAHLRRLPGGDVRLLVVPYMGPRARAWAREHGASWADLSGNADIRARDLRILVEGQTNRYAHPGRPGNPFAPKYARVSRALLADADRWWRQRDLCSETGLSDATVSRAVGHLRGAELLETDSEGAVRARAPSVLLDAWAQRYSFAEHRVYKFQAVARSGNAALQALARRLEGTRLTWAATGLAAAYMYTQFADFRLTTIFVEELPRDPESLGLHPVERGENVWLVIPGDDGVFYKKAEQSVWCAHPVQVYLDLQSHPERAKEAAIRLRSELLTWRA